MIQYSSMTLHRMLRAMFSISAAGLRIFSEVSEIPTGRYFFFDAGTSCHGERFPKKCPSPKQMPENVLNVHVNV